MTSILSRLLRLLMMALLLSLSVTRPAAAAGSGPSILRDAEMEALFRDLGKPLIEAAGLDPGSVRIVLINDPEINAFVSAGQTVYLQSGLLVATDNVNQLQGVVAHELGHVAGGHVIRMQQGSGEATAITLATMILGAVALAAGAGEAGLGVMMAGQRAALGRFLAFSRTQESSADAAAVTYLAKAGVSGKGLLDMYGKFRNREYRLAVYATDSYDRTHPISSERVQALEQKLQSSPAWARPSDPALEERFQRVKAKLHGFVDPKQAIVKYPESDKSPAAHYARAYAYHLGAYPEKALSEVNNLLLTEPENPYFLELKGQILLESGRPAEAIAPLRQATRLSGNSPLIASMLGHSLIATEKRENFVEAKRVLREAIGRDNQNPFAWYQLGIIYGQEGDLARAALASAERNNLEGNPKLALASAQTAMKGIPQGSPDYLRAQDIAMVSRAELAKTDKRFKEKTDK